MCVQIEISRRVTLEELPPVLVLHLKRFVFEKTGGCQKLVKIIDYPVDLEISKGEPVCFTCAPPHPVQGSQDAGSFRSVCVCIPG